MVDAPLQWALPEGLHIQKDELRLRLDFYDTTLVLQTFQNGVVTTRQVSADDVAQALVRDLAVASGLLPANTLWWKNTRNGPLAALWVPPKVRAVALQVEPFKPPTRLRVPMPGAVFLCSPGQAPWVFAAKRRPVNMGEPVFHMPCFNVFKSGKVCPGTHSFSQKVEEIPEEFFLSYFSHTGDFMGRSREHPEDLRSLWTELDGEKYFPAGDLVEAGYLANIMEIPSDADRRLLD